MLAFDDYTEANGATRIIPGSHRWSDDRKGREEEAIPAVCPAGSCVFPVDAMARRRTQHLIEAEIQRDVAVLPTVYSSDRGPEISR